MRHVSSKLLFLLLGVALIFAAFFRLWAAPLSAGPDVAQFWAFARVFQIHGLDFYRYADASLDIFPFKRWGFVYPPVWLLLLSLALLAVPSSIATDSMVDTGWRVAMKAPVIAADLAIGMLLYWAVPGSKWRKLLFSSLWLFHPTAWYESAVFGQFDAIAAALLLASVITLSRDNDRLAFLFAGLAMMTKQHTFIPVAMMVIISARYLNKRRLLTNCFITGGVIILLSIPFLVTGNLCSYSRSLFLPGAAPGYQYPLCFALSGIGASLTYLHDIFGWETSGLFACIIPVLVIALIITVVLSYKRSITPLQGALAGFLIFISLFYRVNYQYLVVYIPLAILLAAQTRYRSEKIITLILAILPAAWIWLTNIPWWFNYLEPTFPRAIPILAGIGLTDRYLPDYVYVFFALVLMFFSLTYIVLALLRWRHRDYDGDSLKCPEKYNNIGISHRFGIASYDKHTILGR